MAKIKTVGTIGEFMANKQEKDARQFTRKLSKVVGTTLPLIVLPTLPAFAQSPYPAAQPAVEAMAAGNLIIHAFDPLIKLIQQLSYPIAGVMLAAGCLFIMIGSKEKGMDMIKNAAIGYILVQLSPILLKILVQVGTQAI